MEHKSSTTFFLLAAEYGGKPAVTLEECLHHLSLDTVVEANRQAAAGILGLPTFRARNSQKSKRQVHLSDLAAFIDARRETGLIEYHKLNARKRAA